ncbi:alpha/beta hydrolase [Streptomyces sp. NPDC002187]|uniref:alpha/beta hydrolase n=1 Tax=Streptomyces sp. NPDC002187 TaxID=3364637 RepID=UPI0036A48752
MSQQVTAPTHRLVPSPAGRIHLVEQGTGPLVLLVHGFPESWYSWRHQLPVLAAAGYRAVAVDVRGYGRSSRPGDTGAYRMLDLVEDNAAAVHALGEQSAVIVGHDWGGGHRRQLGSGQAGRLPRDGAAQCSLCPERRTEAERGLRADGRGRGVLRLLLPGVRPGRGRDRARCARLAGGILRCPVRRHHARPRRPRPVLRQPGREAA